MRIKTASFTIPRAQPSSSYGSPKSGQALKRVEDLEVVGLVVGFGDSLAIDHQLAADLPRKALHEMAIKRPPCCQFSVEYAVDVSCYPG